MTADVLSTPVVARPWAARRWLLPLTALLAVVWILLGAPSAHAQDLVAVPPPAQVTDLTGTLTETDQAALKAKLQAFEAEKGSQIAVLLVPTTQPEAIEQSRQKFVRQGLDELAAADHEAQSVPS